jgi:8-oxo-dGTP pyrophosphatase MutT (NUDIX family)
MQMYKVFCENDRLNFLKPSDLQAEKAANSMFGSALDQIVTQVQLWLNSPDRGDMDIFFDDIKNLESLLEQVFEWRYAAGGVVLHKQQMLMILRNGIPDLPKGHIEPGEAIEMAAIREVSEETGLLPVKIISALPDTFHCYKLDATWVIKKTFWFCMSPTADFEIRPQQEEGITDVKFIQGKDLDEFFASTYRSVREILELPIKNLMAQHPIK